MIQNDHYLHNQSWCLDRIYTPPVAGIKIRVTLRRNAYDEQSYGKAEAWSSSVGWVEVVTRRIQFLACRAATYVSQDGKRALFEQDADELLALALVVVGGA